MALGKWSESKMASDPDYKKRAFDAESDASAARADESRGRVVDKLMKSLWSKVSDEDKAALKKGSTNTASIAKKYHPNGSSALLADLGAEMKEWAHKGK